MAAFNNLNGERDTMVWKEEGSGIFSVSSAYYSLNLSSHRGELAMGNDLEDRNNIQSELLHLVTGKGNCLDS